MKNYPPLTPPLTQGRNERKERYNVSMQHILPLGKGKPEGGQSKI